MGKIDFTKLYEYRQEIDKIDEEILKLYERRMDVITKIGEFKQSNSLSAYDPDRETEVLEKVFEGTSNHAYADGAAQLFITLMQIGCEYQENMWGPDAFSEDPYLMDMQSQEPISLDDFIEEISDELKGTDGFDDDGFDDDEFDDDEFDDEEFEDDDCCDDDCCDDDCDCGCGHHHEHK